MSDGCSDHYETQRLILETATYTEKSQDIEERSRCMWEKNIVEELREHLWEVSLEYII